MADLDSASTVNKHTDFASDEGGRDALRIVQEFMKKTRTEGKVIFAVITGSRAYNADVESSDYDYKAVYLAPTENWLGMEQPREPAPNDKPDIQIYEAKSFCKLALQGNPFALELLYSERFYYCTPEWRELRQLRRQCLTHQAVEEHVEYAKKQLLEHLKRAKAGKRQYHTIRILFAAEDIAAGRDICLWLEGTRRELIMKLRSDGFTGEEFVALAERTIAATSALAVNPPSEAAPKEQVEAWLLRTRLGYLQP